MRNILQLADCCYSQLAPSICFLLSEWVTLWQCPQTEAYGWWLNKENTSPPENSLKSHRKNFARQFESAHYYLTDTSRSDSIKLFAEAAATYRTNLWKHPLHPRACDKTRQKTLSLQETCALDCQSMGFNRSAGSKLKVSVQTMAAHYSVIIADQKQEVLKNPMRPFT